MQLSETSTLALFFFSTLRATVLASLLRLGCQVSFFEYALLVFAIFRILRIIELVSFFVETNCIPDALLQLFHALLAADSSAMLLFLLGPCVLPVLLSHKMFLLLSVLNLTFSFICFLRSPGPTSSIFLNA